MTMYSTPLPGVSMNNIGGEAIDGSGTINPAALNTPGTIMIPSLCALCCLDRVRLRSDHFLQPRLVAFIY